MTGLPDDSAGTSRTATPGAPEGEAEQATAHRNRAILLSLQGRFAESESHSRLALSLRPDDVDVLNELGVALWRQGRTDEAEAVYRRALGLKPDDFRILTNLGLALMDLGRGPEAIECFRAALQVRPDTFEARMNLGILISNRGDFRQAMGPLLGALELRPDSADALQNLAMNLARDGDWAAAAAHYERAVELRPNYPEAHRNLGYARLACGDFERGWPEYEWRLRCHPHPGVRINRTFWNGDDFRDRTILVHFEQGYGDTLQFVRYAPMVKRRGGRVVLLCQPALVRLLSRCEGVDLAFDGTCYEPECHIQVPLMSLPVIFGTTLETIPARVPYLVAEPAQIAHWRGVMARLPALDAGETRARPLRVGIAWQGRPENGADHWRSFPLAELAPLAELPGVQLISLQVGHGAEQVAALGGRFPVVELPGRRGREFSETAAIASSLDLVVAPCTAIAHLAGGLGRPVWVPLSYAADWRWMIGRDDSPWYPTMRLFRQTRLGDWAGVFRRMAAALEDFRDRRRAGPGSEAEAA